MTLMYLSKLSSLPFYFIISILRTFSFPSSSPIHVTESVPEEIVWTSSGLQSNSCFYDTYWAFCPVLDGPLIFVLTVLAIL